MKIIGNFYSSNAKEKFQLEVNITGINYLNKEDSSCLERGLDNYISNLFFNDLSSIAKQIYEYLNNCEIPKKDFDLTITLVENKSVSVLKDEKGDTEVKVYLDEQRSPYKKETVSYKNGEFQSYLIFDNTDGVKQFDYSSGKCTIILDNAAIIIQDFVNIELNKIEELKKVIPVKLDAEVMNIIKSYSLFYSKALDPNDEFVVGKLRYMLYILQSFNVKGLPPIWSYVSSCTTDYNLINIINQLKKVEIISHDSSFNLNEKTCKQILAIGEVVEKFIGYTDDNLYNLFEFCKVIEYIKESKSNPFGNFEIPIKLIRKITANNAKN